jgi:hypothetical protein
MHPRERIVAGWTIHSGTIYKASNFKEIGLTSPNKYVELTEKKISEYL